MKSAPWPPASPCVSMLCDYQRHHENVQKHFSNPPQNRALPLYICRCLRCLLCRFQVLLVAFAVWIAFPHALYDALCGGACAVPLYHDVNMRWLVCARLYPLAVVYAPFRADKDLLAAVAHGLLITHFAHVLWVRDRKTEHKSDVLTLFLFQPDADGTKPVQLLFCFFHAAEFSRVIKKICCADFLSHTHSLLYCVILFYSPKHRK